jgi:uncharacterized protein YfeS
MGARILTAGKSYLAAKQAAHEDADINTFVFAYIDGLDTSTTPPLDEVLPDSGDIVDTQAVTRDGYVNPSQVVYSILLGSNIGDYQFNWVGLKASDGTLCAVAYVETVQKKKYIPASGQIGNNITRNFLMDYPDIATITDITVAAEAWQIDFTGRLNASDFAQQRSNKTLTGSGAVFLSSALLLYNSSGYKLTAGVAIINGLRADIASDIVCAGAGANKSVWVDMYRTGDTSGVTVFVDAVVDDSTATHTDYTDSFGVYHSVVLVGMIDGMGAITDNRATVGEVFNVSRLLDLLAFRTGTYSGLRAQATTKADVGLSSLPNAKSDSITLNDSNTLGTSKAVTAAVAAAQASLTGHEADHTNPHAVTKLQVGLGTLPNAKSDSITLNDTNTLATSKAVKLLNDEIGQTQVGISAVVWYPNRAMIPANFFPADGQVANRADFPIVTANLANLPAVSDTDWVGTPANRASYSLGDGSTTFRFPDYNGTYSDDISLVLRGDGGNSAAEGKVQRDAIQNITGSLVVIGGGNIATGVFAANGPAHPQIDSSTTGNNDSITFDASRVARTAIETRMSNVAGVFCICVGAHAVIPP